ncbi:hypothetical protein LWI29_013728 [Acer saccharum]|uniref:Reverse transcriptase zinc-binding domain-containing protein n=1 Tax=Acer saccharum TaxID=4024 RepID=A0AA39S1L6_ACESA|nr:hypothetical protein LWI29_013728 [Acer saccharum]
MISSIPQSNSVTADSVVWHYEKNGEYTVRSGYKVAMINGQVTSLSGLGGCNTLWNSIWKLGIPGKIKVFIWRVCHQWILSLVSLERRGIQVEWLCPRCNRKPDTISHALWGCSKLKEIRKASKVWSE